MPHRWTAPAAVLLAAFLATPGSFGQEGRGTIRLKDDGEGAGSGRKWAVVVGVNEYVDPALPALKYCVADAELMAKRLTERCGYEKDRVLVITDNQAQVHLRPLKRNLQVQVQDWLKRAGPKDTVLVFFAGHGFLDARGQGFLATQDCERENLGLTALRTDDLRDMLRQCKASQKLLVLDCCHAGGDRGEGDAGASPEELGASFRGAEGLVTLASCKKDQTSREWAAKGQGLFTYFLAEGLSGKADGDGDGVVDSDELYEYSLEQVSLVGQRELNARQTPVRIIGEDVVGRFALAKVKGVLKVAVRPVGDPVRHPNPVLAVALGPDGRYGVSASNGTAVLWDMTGERVVTRKLVEDRDINMMHAAFSPDGRLVLTSGAPKNREAAQLWEASTGRAVGPPMVHGGVVHRVAFSPDGRTLLTVGGREARLWDAATRRPLGSPLAHRSDVLSGVFSPDGGTVLTGDGFDLSAQGDKGPEEMKGEARLWSVKARGPVGKPLTFDGRVRRVGYGKNGRFFTATSGGLVEVWRLGDGGPVGKRLPGRYAGAALSPDGSRCVTWGPDGMARLWDVETARQVGPLMPHDEPINDAVFSPDGALILTGSGKPNRGRATLWDGRTGLPVGSPLVHARPVEHVAFSGDGRKVMTGGRDRTARLWEVVRSGQ